MLARLQREPASPNVASYVGHNTIRSAVMGSNAKRVAKAAEVAKMQALLQRELNAGALGLSTGLEYEPSSYSEPAEVVALARTAASVGGRYISHMRSEDLRIDAAIDELLAVGRQACMPVQISHFKIAIRTRWFDAPDILRKLDAARADGVEVTAEIYPYDVTPALSACADRPMR